MARAKAGVIRWLVSLVALACVALGVYKYLYGRASDRVKAEILGVVEEIVESPENRADLRRWIEEAHPEAFAQALDVSRDHGSKFDGPRYFRFVFDSVIAQARAEGKTRLADTLERERVHFRFETSEQ